MDSSFWPIVFAAGLLLLGVLLLVVLLRVRALAGVAGTGAEVRSRFETLAAQNERLERELRSELVRTRSENAHQAQTARGELSASLSQFTQTLQAQLGTIAGVQNERLATLTQTVEQRLEVLRADNAQKLEQIRTTVDEKLHAALEQRLGESFKLVSDQQVHKGLGEMQTLATGVGDLKKVLTNVKTRGTWGEVQLENLLEQILAPGQYDKNVATRPGSNERVEFAIRLPGKDADGAPCLLPIDAKFPLADYQQLVDAQERADPVAVELFAKALERRIKDQAADIHAKYVEPPHTTDFALLYLPVEGLYAEVLRRPGLADTIQRDSRVNVVGPTTLAAMLNSLQMGFRTLAIEQRSSEVWRVLGAVKTEFGRFGELLAKTKDRLDAVGKTLDEAGRKSTTIARKLRDVEALPEAEADRLLTGEPGIDYDLNDAEAEPAPGDAH
ncbi:MAG: DNA recombination protein RmuC [Betaproteobacteria bacterium]|nr:MAG: DNA recombination protein RmuC [Betaproteobacteria bacterium]